MTRREGSDSRRLATLTELARDAVDAPTALQLERGLNRLRARLAKGAPRRGVPWKSLLAVALLSLVAAVILPRWLGRSNAPATPVVVTHVEGGKILEGGYLSELGHSGIQLSFSEGSQFVLAPGTRGRLLALDVEGARLALDHGTASFRITPSAERRWWVEAGPFVVSVRGTEFSVSWDPTAERFEVKLRKGRVAVNGPVVGEELVLRPGQNLSVSLAKGETLITEGRNDEPPPPASPSAAQAGPSAAPSAVSSAAPLPAPARAAASGARSERRWREALANGEWDRILADVERDGVESSLRTLSSDELFALADAARYRRRPELARIALLTQRERFPNSSRALDAVFLLGRVEEMHAGGKRTAIGRYDEYLSRAPAGTYAAEALGRRMILLKEVEGPESARHAAEEYLRRFPSGSYAEVARSLDRGR